MIGQFCGPYSPVWPTKLKLFSAVKMSSEDSSETYLKGLYADKEKRPDALQDEENLPNFHVERQKSSQLKES